MCSQEAPEPRPSRPNSIPAGTSCAGGRRARLREHRPTMPAVRGGYPAAKASLWLWPPSTRPWQRCHCRRCLAASATARRGRPAPGRLATSRYSGLRGAVGPAAPCPSFHLSLHEAAPHLPPAQRPSGPRALSATAAAADFQPLLDSGEPCIEVECGAARCSTCANSAKAARVRPSATAAVSAASSSSSAAAGRPRTGNAASATKVRPPWGRGPLRSLASAPRTRGSGSPSSATWETQFCLEGAATLGRPGDIPFPQARSALLDPG